MIPCRGKMIEQHVPDIRFGGDLAQRFSGDSRFAGNGHGACVVEEPHAHHPTLIVIGDPKSARETHRLAGFDQLLEVSTFGVAPYAGMQCRLRKRPREPRVGYGTMVALAIVFHHKLPVPVLDDTAFERDLGVAQIKGHEIRFDLHLQGSNAWRLSGNAHEDEAADAPDVPRFEPVSSWIESIARLTRAGECAIKFIGPLVIGADKPALHVAVGCGANLEATMPARVVMDTQLAGLIAHDDQSIGAELHREIVARFRDLTLMAGEDPLLIEDEIQVEIEH